jgi:hypothetical protein
MPGYCDAGGRYGVSAGDELNGLSETYPRRNDFSF